MGTSFLAGHLSLGTTAHTDCCSEQVPLTLAFFLFFRDRWNDSTCRVSLTIRKLEHEILEAGHHVCILTTVSGDSEHTDLVGTHPNRQVIFMDNAKPIPFMHDPEKPGLTYQVGFALSNSVKQQIDEFEPSIVHLTVPDCTSLHLIQYARSKEIPLMGTYHSNIPDYMEHYPGLSWLKHILGAFFRHQYNYLQTLYVPTPYIQRHLEKDYTMDRVTTMKVWGRGVDVNNFNPAYRSLEYRRSLGIADNTAVVLWVGRLVPEKRTDIFTSVVRRLHSRGLNFHALVVGAGPGETEIKSLPNTTFLGWMSAEQLSTVYASSDVFLFPSAVETFGNVTLEAAASGMPLVVEAGCSGHLVHDCENGFTATAGDEDAFFEATLALVEDRAMREEFGVNSREMSLSLEKSAVMRQMLDNYTRITDEFYTEYSGHHRNRDSVYTQPGSFLLGKYPRPMILVFFEYVFILIFQLCWNLSVLWDCLGARVCRKQRQKKAEQDSVPAAVCESPKMVISRPSSPARAAIKTSSPSKLSIVELHDVEIGNCNREPLLCADDNTVTTTSSSHESSPSAAQSFGDGRLSHSLTKLFVKSVQFQCRIESHVRQFFTCSPAHNTFMGAAKRKNSSMVVGGMSEMLERPEINMRVRLDANEMDDVSLSRREESPPAASNMQEGRIMRRAQSYAIDVY